MQLSIIGPRARTWIAVMVMVFASTSVFANSKQTQVDPLAIRTVITSPVVEVESSSSVEQFFHADSVVVFDVTLPESLARWLEPQADEQSLFVPVPRPSEWHSMWVRSLDMQEQREFDEQALSKRKLREDVLTSGVPGAGVQSPASFVLLAMGTWLVGFPRRDRSPSSEA